MSTSELGRTEEGMRASLSRDNVRVDLEYTGEGWFGDYDPDDPDDERLLRLTIRRCESSEHEDLVSCCTQLPTSISDADAEKALSLIMKHVHGPVTRGESVRTLTEKLSWITLAWLTGQLPKDLLE